MSEERPREQLRAYVEELRQRGRTPPDWPGPTREERGLLHIADEIEERFLKVRWIETSLMPDGSLESEIRIGENTVYVAGYLIEPE